MVVAVIGPYELLGEMGAVDGAPHGVTARAADACKLRAIPRKDFKAWLQQEPDVAAHVMATLVQRLRAADGVIAGQRPGLGGGSTAVTVVTGGGAMQVAQPGGGFLGAVASWLRSRGNKRDAGSAGRDRNAVPHRPGGAQ